MIGIADALHQVFANRDWSRDERAAIEDVLDAAAAFVAFELPLGDALAVGELFDASGKRSDPAFGRVRAVLAAHPEDPRRSSLLSMLDIAIAAQAGMHTNMGFFAHDDLRGSGVTVRNRPTADVPR